METEFPFATPGPATDEPAAVDFACEEVPEPFAFDPDHLIDTQGRRDDGRPDFAFYRLPACDAVRITGAADFLVADDRIRCRLVDPVHRYLVETALFGMVFAVWLERHGVPTLHAAAAVVGGRGVAFLAQRGSGKTSLVTGCVEAGHQLLTDDLLAVGWGTGVALARRGLPSLRLWPDQLRHFLGTVPDLSVVHPDHEKRRVPVGDGFGRFADGAAPLARIYLPERVEGVDAVSIRSLEARHAAIALLRQSFLPREVERFGLQEGRLRQFARMVGSVPVAALTYPSGFDRLPDVVEAIERDLERE